MKALRRALLIIFLIIVVLIAGGFLLFNDITRGPLPQTEGVINVPGLEGQVEVLRDRYGVPHIYASTRHDLFFAQGFVQAQDRWWQMEFNRHVGRGAIQELTGKNDDLMGTDVFIRTVGWWRVAERDYALLSEEAQTILQAFADGVNAYLNSRTPDDLAMEYTLLRITGVNIPVEPWTPIDTMVWARVMAWNLTDTFDRELVRASLLETVGEAMADSYTPPWPYGERPTIVRSEDLPLSDESLAVSNTGGSRTTDLTVAGGLIAGEMAQMVRDIFGMGEHIGSNNWVATGSMTQNGLPLLANDPHLGIGMPSIWYEIGLHCLPLSEECPFDVAGFTFSANPGVVIGHNANIAWGVTNVGADVQDLYRIEVNPENELQYRWNGEWRDMTVREETIRFGDGEPPVTIRVRETHLGPIFNDNQIDPETGEIEGFNNEDPLALRWTGYEQNTIFQSVIELNRASNWTEFRDALRSWDVPSQNFVYADVLGNIGYQTPGRMPIRAAGHDGLMPVDGTTDAYEWRGFIPFDELPRIYNPERDYIVTANQAVVELAYYEQLAERLGEDANYLLSYDWSYGQRGERIDQLMTELAPHSVETYQRIHGDNLDITAAQILDVLRTVEIEDAALSEVRDWLTAWDARAEIDSAQAAFYGFFARRLIDNLFTDQLPEDVRPSSHQLHPARLLMDDPENPWWDDAGTEDITETRDDILRRTLQEAYDEARAELGADRSAWRWGALHTATFVSNPLGLSGIDLIENMVNRGPVETSGGNEIVNATGWSLGSGNFRVGSLPSMRVIYDVSNWDNSVTIHTTGQSGHPFSAHYSDLIEMWRSIEYKPFPFTRSQVERATTQRLVLTPASR